VRGLVGISEARRTGRGADAFLIEQDEQRFGFDAMESDVGGVGQALCFVAIQLGVGD